MYIYQGFPNVWAKWGTWWGGGGDKPIFQVVGGSCQPPPPPPPPLGETLSMAKYRGYFE